MLVYAIENREVIVWVVGWEQETSIKNCDFKYKEFKFEWLGWR